MAQPFFSEKFSRQLMEMIALGHVENSRLVTVFGNNHDVGATREDIWAAGGIIVEPATAFVASVVSTDADDTSAGAGAQTIRLDGLDADYNEVSATVIMDGLTPVLTTQTFIRINHANAVTDGATGWNEGDITVSLNSNVQATIEAVDASSHDSHYCVPAGYTLYITEITAFGGKDFEAEIPLVIRQFGETWRSPGHFDTYRNQVTVNTHGAVQVLEKGDVKLQGIASGAGDAVYTFMVGILRKN